MAQIGLYSFEGTYSGMSDYEYAAPASGDRHACVLFLSQEGEQAAWDQAKAEIGRYGFTEMTPHRHDALLPEQIDSPSFRGFKVFHDEALEKGSSLFFHPNATDPDEF